MIVEVYSKEWKQLSICLKNVRFFHLGKSLSKIDSIHKRNYHILHNPNYGNIYQAYFEL